MLILENDLLTVEFSTKGAELRRIFDKRSQEEVMWDGTPEIWNGVSPILFPIIGRLWEFKYEYENKSYELGLHGFLRDYHFEVNSQDDNHICFKFDSTDETYEVYPFKHSVLITYTLISNKLDIKWEIINLDEKEMYYSIGAHPAFVVNKTDDYEFIFEGNDYISQYFNEEGYITSSETIKRRNYTLTNTLFENDALMFNRINAITLSNKTKKKDIRVDFRHFDYVAIWAKYYEDKRAPFVCIEPWIGMPDYKHGGTSLNNKFGIKSLGAQRNHTYQYSISIIHS